MAAFEVKQEGESDQAFAQFLATTAGDAARAWAAEVDRQGGDQIVSGDTPVVLVRCSDGEIQRFKVYGERRPTYWVGAPERQVSR